MCNADMFKGRQCRPISGHAENLGHVTDEDDTEAFAHVSCTPQRVQIEELDGVFLFLFSFLIGRNDLVELHTKSEVI